MAHVAEESGLCAIQFGQRFGAPSLLFISSGVGDGRRNVSCHQSYEAAIIIVKSKTRADACDEKTRERRLPGFCERKRYGSLRRRGPRAARKRVELFFQVGDYRASRFHHFAKRPRSLFACESDDGGSGWRAAFDSCRGCEPCSGSGFVKKVEKREWKVEGILFQNLSSDLADFLRTLYS